MPRGRSLPKNARHGRGSGRKKSKKEGNHASPPRRDPTAAQDASIMPKEGTEVTVDGAGDMEEEKKEGISLNTNAK